MDQDIIETGTNLTIFHQKHSVAIRIWHWVLFLFISGSMITVLLASTLLDPHTNVGMIQEQLNKKGVIVTEEQAFAVTHKYEDLIWEIHKWIGIGLVILLLARMVIEFAVPADQKIRNRIKNAIGLYNKFDKKQGEYLHYLSVKRVYMIFYLLLFCMSFTGLGLAFGHELHLSRPTHHFLKTIHNLGQYGMYAFVFIHLCGVIIAENNKIKGIVSGMIHGKLP